MPCIFSVMLVLSCTGEGRREQAVRHFPQVKIPAVISEPSERMEYVLMHMWDDFEGVGMDEIEKAFPNFIALMQEAPMPVAQKAMEVLFDKICVAEKADTGAHHYVLMTQLVSKYLYDPNSPLRNEDYYLPFVSRMAVSALTDEDLRAAYRYEAESCAICRYGTVAEDFVIRTPGGKNVRMHQIGARRTILFFSNPGCGACRDIAGQIRSVPDIAELVEDGEVAVVNVYIDEDLEAWKQYVNEYPDYWISGYDLYGVIRSRRIYDVRAIPSLYLLDEEKRVLLKDAPVERILKEIINH